MEYLPKIKELLSQELKIPEEKVTLSLKVGDVEEWDSLGHLSLIISVEQAFGIKFKTEQIVALNSVEAILKALESQ